jgi:hypothetical protein
MERPRQLVFALCTAFLSTTAAAQTTVTRVFTRDAWTYAQNFQTSPDGCESVGIDVFAFKNKVRFNNVSVFMPVIRAQLVSSNFCTGVFMFLAGDDQAPNIDIKQDLTRATAVGSVVMRDEFNYTRALLVGLTWSGGEISTDKSRTTTTSPFTRYMVRTTASIRNSTSITGTLVLDGVDLLAASNPAQSRSISGYVVGAKGSTIDIVRTP